MIPSIFIHAFNGRKETIDRLQEIGLHQIALSGISIMELYQGTSNKIELAQLKRKKKYYDVLEIDTATFKLATSLMENFKLSHGLQIPDAIIGATAVIHQVPFYTYNIKDFYLYPVLN